ncbi:MAG: T9SS type A sorting domain-containing protein, partial [Bacteroidota bacterium]
FGGNSAVTVTASGGTAPYTGIGVFTTVAGNYTYTVTDANGCSAVANGSINQPPQLLATSGFNPIPCTGASTSVSVTAGGGTAPYAGIGNFLRTAGPYSFIVTDANGCTTTASGNIPQPALLTVTAQSGIILCNSGTTSIIINAAGGTSPYNGTGTFTVPAGNYSYTVTDANGCTASTSQSISHPTSLIATVTTGSILCFGGNTTVSVSATGGTAPYTGTGLFTRLAGVYSLPITDANGCSTTVSGTLIQPTALVTNSTQGTISCSGGSTTVLVSATGGTAPYLGVGIYNVGVGAYSYQVTDANGCTSNVVGSISQPTQLTASLSSSSINCFGGQSVITINASGGTAPYSGTGTFSRPSGSYTFNISDANGCSTTSSVLVSQPNPLSASVNTTPATTVGGNNGSATANVSGGSPAYTYRWSNNSTSATATGLTAGIYTVTVTDANGCTVTAAASVGDPSCNLTLIITGTDIPCFGGTTAVNVVASGGTPPYTGAGSFVRSAGPFSTTVTDAIGCSAVVSSTIHQPAQLIAAASTSNIGCYGGTSSVNISAVGGTIPYSGTGLFNRNAGAFSYIVEDANGCSDTVSGNILQPAAISISSSSGNIACNGGSTTVIINASGGTLPYSGIGTFTRTAGNHPFTVTDGNSCSQTINVQLNQPDRLIADAGISGDYCRATLISLGGNPTAQGGTSSYTYQWTPSAGLNNNTSSNPTTIINQSTVYQLAVTDANGCRATDSIVMRATGPVTPTISSTGFCNGSGSLLVSNADPSYSFTWNTGESSRSITAFTPGTYIVTASDSQGCFASGSIQISTAPNCDGYLLISSPLSVNLFDTIGVVVSIRNADRIFSVFTAVGFDTTLLRFVGGTPYRPFGSSTNVSVAVQQGSNVQFGVYQSFGSPAFNGSADLYLIRFVVDPLDSTINLNTNLTPYLSTLFTLSNINVTDSAGIRPASFQQNTSDSTTTFIYYFVPVWPGDLDNNNRSDVADVLPIGYFFNATGPSRQNASTAWIGQPAPLWGIDRSALNGSAYKTFADANGDGFINLSDKSPILQHIGSQHARMARPPFRSIESFAPPRTQPVLSINLADSSLLRSSLPYTEQAVISIGDAIIPYVDLYGVAFDLYFDPAFVNTSSIVVNFNGSVFGNLNSDFIQVTDTSDISSGRLSIGMTRFNNSPVTAFGGPLVSVGFPITASAPNGWFVVDMNPITANDEVGFRHSVVDQDDSLLISGLVSAGTAPEPFSFDVFPNPTTGSFTLRMNQSFMKPDNEIRVISMIGQTVFETLLTEQITSIKLGESVTNGLYVVLINDNSGKVIGQRRVVLQR